MQEPSPVDFPHRGKVTGELRLLLYTTAFAPRVGGLEFMAKLLAEELGELGCRVTVITTTPGEDGESSYRLVREPPPWVLMSLVRAADAVLLMNISLRGLLPFLLVPRPWIASHQTHYGERPGATGLRERLKRLVARRAANIACSRAIARDLPDGTVVVHNAYDDRVFRPTGAARTRDLIFVGRLVSDKGADLLLQAMRLVRDEGVSASLTIVGFGPEEEPLRQYCRDNRLEGQVAFAGQRAPAEIAALLNSHRVMVVPSRVEPFGIVALEGVACGCILVGSDAGGLPEAIGGCGVLFKAGDAAALAAALARALSDADLAASIASSRADHVARFTRRAVARRYAEVIHQAASSAARR